MKMVIFMIVLALVVFTVMWRVRKADAQKDLERRKAMQQKQQQRQDAIKTENPVEWPVIIRPAGKGEEAQGEEKPEPTMTSIEFEPGDHVRPSH